MLPKSLLILIMIYLNLMSILALQLLPRPLRDYAQEPAVLKQASTKALGSSQLFKPYSSLRNNLAKWRLYRHNRQQVFMDKMNKFSNKFQPNSNKFTVVQYW